MATRATYKFISDITGTHTAYIHSDGYPEYAYNYLENAASIDAFMVKNDRAEITESHEIHGDTDYRYTIQNGCVVCEKRTWFESDDEEVGYEYKWDIEFIGTVEQLVKKYKS